MATIEGNVLVKVYNEDITNGTFFIPNSVISIGPYAFGSCKNLQHIVIPENVINIGIEAFAHCENLQNISLPSSVTSIGKRTFSGCKSLQNIVIPNSVTSIGTNTFTSCKSLQNISLPNSVTSIEAGTFSDCKSLESIVIPSSVTNIKEDAFAGCSSLQNIVIPESVTSVGKYAFFGCQKLQNISLPDSVTSIGEYAFYDCQNLQYLKRQETDPDDPYEYLYQNLDFVPKLQERAKKNNSDYTIEDLKRDLDKVLSETEILNYFHKNDYSLTNCIDYSNVYDLNQRLNIIYPKTRFRNIPSLNVLTKFDINHLKNFDLKTWNKYATNPLFKANNETKQALVELTALFGLFKKDEHFNSRINHFEKLFTNITLSETEMQAIKESMDSEFVSPENEDGLKDKELQIVEQAFKKEMTYIYELNPNIDIPREFEEYLGETLSEEQIQIIKSKTGSFGKRLNDFIKVNYTEKATYKYVLDKNYKDTLNYIDFSGNEVTETVEEIIWRNSFGLNILTPNALHRMFDGVNQIYGENKLNFLINNWPFIMKSETNQSNLKSILNNFDTISAFYASKGNSNFDYIDALTYMKALTFENIELGNEEFASLVKNAGVNEQASFEFYQNAYKQMRKRHSSTIANHEKIYTIEIDGQVYDVKTKMLDLDDPFALLVGETKYTNCCQTYHNAGEECMRHATEKGRIFCTYIIEDGIEKLLSQSWTWTNGNLLCFDNIEGTELLTQHDSTSKRNQKLVVSAYKLASEDILESSKQNLETALENLNLTEEEKGQIRQNQTIKAITVGEGYNDANCNKYFPSSKLTTGPKGYYGYRDSHSQRLIAGDDNINITETPEIPIYRTPRQITVESKDISTTIQRDIKDLNEKPKEINYQYYDNLNIIKGSDWYIIYDDAEELEILEAIKCEPRFKEEEEIQNEEYKGTLKEIIKSCFHVEDGEITPIKPINTDLDLTEIIEELKQEFLTYEPSIEEKNHKITR